MRLTKNEFLAIYWKDMVKFSRSKAMLFSSLIQPILWLIVYGLSMSNNMNMFFPVNPDLTDTLSLNYMTFIAAGVIGMTILFTCLYAGQHLQFDRHYGLMKEMMLSPMPRLQVLAGVTLSGATKALIQTVIIMVFGYFVGVQFFSGFTVVETVVSLLGIFLFAILFSTSLLFISSSIAMRINNHETVQALITLLTLPLFFASNALYPIESLPAAIKIVSYFNPLAYFINGVRYFSVGSDFYFQGIHYSYNSNQLLLSLGFLVVFNLITFLCAYWVFKTAKDF
ncbi:MAG: ABC transporter permease [archaeon]|nr:ABC transporter permease [Candidatus Bathyarchaeum sp.]